MRPPAVFRLIVMMHTDGKRSVKEIAAEIGRDPAHVSQAFRWLRQLNLVRRKRQGTCAIYSLTTLGRRCLPVLMDDAKVWLRGYARIINRK